MKKIMICIFVSLTAATVYAAKDDTDKLNTGINGGDIITFKPISCQVNIWQGLGLTPSTDVNDQQTKQDNLNKK